VTKQGFEYNFAMSKFKTNYPIEVRFSDLDPLWHVNNARFISFIEQARHRYLYDTGLYDGKDFWSLPLIVGDVHCRYRNPIQLGDAVTVSIGVTRIAEKTITMEYDMTGANGTPLYATAETIMVGYDYQSKTSMPIPDEIRKKLEDYEGKAFPKEG
jgi:acyl-CoA thioester hydrolase